MRAIAGPGAVSNRFVDYDAVSNPDGTVYTADFGNDVQDELIGIQDEMGITQAAGTNKYVRAAIIGMAIKYGKKIGELFFADEVDAPAEFDEDNPEDFWPAKCLDSITAGYEDISETNWPDLVPHLRAKALKVAGVSSMGVTAWAVASNVGTLTFDTGDELDMLAALAEDLLVHGSYSNWRTVTLAAAIGNIPAGDYAITALDASAGTVTFAVTASDGGASGTWSAIFYESRIPGSTTTARIFQASGRTLVSSYDDNSKRVPGLRLRGAMQRITGTLTNIAGGGYGPLRPSGVMNGVFSQGSGTTYTANVSTSSGYALKFDSADSVSPNPAITDDDETRGPELAGHLYIWGRRYVA